MTQLLLPDEPGRKQFPDFHVNNTKQTTPDRKKAQSTEHMHQYFSVPILSI